MTIDLEVAKAIRSEHSTAVYDSSRTDQRAVEHRDIWMNDNTISDFNIGADISQWEYCDVVADTNIGSDDYICTDCDILANSYAWIERST
jgi:hypothetical protein